MILSTLSVYCFFTGGELVSQAEGVAAQHPIESREEVKTNNIEC